VPMMGEARGDAAVAVDRVVTAAATPVSLDREALRAGLEAASVLPMTEPVDDHPHSAAGGASRYALLLAGVWLVFLIEPVYSQRDRAGEPLVILAIVASVAFAATYLAAIWSHVQLRAQWQLEFPLLKGYGFVVALMALAALMWLGLDQRGSGAIIFVTVTAALALPTRHALVAIPLIAGLELLLTFVVPKWEADFYTPAIACTAGFMMWGAKEIMGRNLELIRVRYENERLVVEQERNRFARDLHDILGHSLTVITVKTELAQRLLDIDIERTRAELADLEMLSRESLADVRRAVQGYREISLPGEIARARLALTAAGIEHILPNSTDDVPHEHRELFAWVIREGVTNVIRHSGAETCTVGLSGDRVSVVDDGRGLNGRGPYGVAAGGNGLAGLHERAAALGARVVVGRAEPEGFTLEVVVR
jgi:two-component system sensor histidine kinase DesK